MKTKDMMEEALDILNKSGAKVVQVGNGAKITLDGKLKPHITGTHTGGCGCCGGGDTRDRAARICGIADSLLRKKEEK